MVFIQQEAGIGWNKSIILKVSDAVDLPFASCMLVRVFKIYLKEHLICTFVQAKNVYSFILLPLLRAYVRTGSESLNITVT